MALADRTLRVRQENLTWRKVGGEIIALDLVTSTYFTTNASGAVLWEAMLEGAAKPALVEALQRTFGLEEQAAARDVEVFVELLSSNGLLDDEG